MAKLFMVLDLEGSSRLDPGIIADSGVYGLLTKGASQTYDDNTWVQATGTLKIQYHKQLGQTLPILEIKEAHSVEKPTNPYVYRVF